jgi:membrane protein
VRSPRTWPALLGRAARNFYADSCLDRSAAVAYFSLLSLGPSIYLMSLVTRRLFPGFLAPDGTALTGARSFFPPAVVPMLEKLTESLKLDGTLVVVALPGLVWVASSAFLSLELAVNVAFRTVAKRRFWLARLKAFLGSLLAGAMLLVSAAVTQAVEWVNRSRDALGLAPMRGPVPGLSSLAHLATTFGAVALLYKILPRGRVRWRVAAASAAVSVVAWELARRVFGRLLESSPGFGLLSGSLSGIVSFLLWVYTAVAVVLLGAELAAVLNGNRSEEGGDRSAGVHPIP